MLGMDLFNCAPSGLGSFKQATGATYPLLLDAALALGGDIRALYGERDHYVVIDRQGIVRYQGNDRWPYGNGYHPDEIRACVDALLAARRPPLVRQPARQPRQEPGAPARSER